MMIALIFAMLLIGVFAGYLARLLLIGPDPMSFWQTIGLGIIGSFIGGLIGGAIAGRLYFGPAPLGLSVVGAMIALLIQRKIRYGTIAGHGRSSSRPPMH
jgi:uncharacterized membrane protein YeaQ/YmgE (transglycosylase-associated protein family)